MKTLPFFISKNDWNLKNFEIIKKKTVWTRSGIDFIWNFLNFDKFYIKLKKEKNLILDKILQFNLNLNLSENSCLNKKFSINSITNYINYLNGTCSSGIVMDHICIADFQSLSKIKFLPQFFFSKFLPSINFGPYICWRKNMFKRTYSNQKLEPKKSLEPFLQFYNNHPIIKFQKMKNINKICE